MGAFNYSLCTIKENEDYLLQPAFCQKFYVPKVLTYDAYISLFKIFNII